jgi:hypothetical protein
MLHPVRARHDQGGLRARRARATSVRPGRGAAPGFETLATMPVDPVAPRSPRRRAGTKAWGSVSGESGTTKLGWLVKLGPVPSRRTCHGTRQEAVVSGIEGSGVLPHRCWCQAQPGEETGVSTRERGPEVSALRRAGPHLETRERRECYATALARGRPRAGSRRRKRKGPDDDAGSPGPYPGREGSPGSECA